MRAFFLVGPLYLAGCGGLPAESPRAAPAWRALAEQVTIHRDAFGVPHVLGETDAATLFGYAYARAEDELERVERATFLMLGRNAEVLGEAGLAWDRLVHMLDVPGRAQRSYADLAPNVRELVDAACAGFNLYRELHPDGGPRLLPRFEPWQLLAHDYAWHLYAASEELRRVLPEVAPPPVGGAPNGSNAWALAPARTRDGRALLLANPHIDLDEVYEGHLDSAEGLRISGMNAFGRDLLPILGHGGEVAWALTVNAPDVVDLYALETGEIGGELAYRHGSSWRRLEVRSARVKVRAEDGTLEPRELRWHVAHQGPVVGRREGQPLALRVAGLERRGAFEAFLGMARARSLEELWEALAAGGLLFHNVVGADAAGRIGYIYNGLLPRRSSGPDWSLPVDGADPATDWQGYHAQAELPQVLDPPGGWLQNCNGSPFGSSAEGVLRPSDFPAELVGDDRDDARTAMSRALLSRAEPFDLAGLAEAAFDSRVHAADGWIEALAREADQLTETEPARVAVLMEPLSVLQAWDRHARVDSIGATLFFLYFALARDREEDGEAGPLLVAAFERALFELRRDYSAWQVPWGDVNRHQRPAVGPYPYDDRRPSWPVPGGPGAAGLQWCYQSSRNAGALRHYGYHGSSYVGVYELGPSPRALSVVPFGASRDSDSPHHLDQAPLFVTGRLKPAWWSRKDVRAHATRSYTPGAGVDRRP